MKNFKLLFASLMIAAGLTFLAACNTDKCKDVVCQNSGTCLEGVCNCPSGVHGKFCDTLDRAAIIGTYQGTESCTIGTDAYNITITTSSTAVDKVIISDLYHHSAAGTGAGAYVVTGTVNGSTLTIPSQTVTGGSSTVTISGTGTISGSGVNLSITYTAAGAVGSNSCTFTGTKL